MNAFEFNNELKKVIDRAVMEGVFAGKISFSEFVGTIEIFKAQGMAVIHQQLAKQQKANVPIILRPPNGFKPPGS